MTTSCTVFNATLLEAFILSEQYRTAVRLASASRQHDYSQFNLLMDNIVQRTDVRSRLKHLPKTRIL